MIETCSGWTGDAKIRRLYRLEFTEDDLVIFRPRTKKETYRQNIILPEWAEEQARKIAHNKGWDYYAQRGKWMDFAAASIAKGDPPKDTGEAFVAYCKKQSSLR